MTPFDALVKYARSVCDAREWLYELSTLERQMVATTAAALYGTEPLEPTTVVVRKVYEALLKPSVLLGVGTCECGNELDINSRCPSGCMDLLDCEPERFVPKGRDHRGWLRKAI